MPSSQIRTDTFPANVTVTSTSGYTATHHKVRVILTLDHLYIFKDASPAPVLILDEPLVSYTPPPPTTKHSLNKSPAYKTAQAETDSHTISFYKDPGCGCGSRLKSMSAQQLLPSNTAASASSIKDV